ncbi:MAG TPA: Uma2 family endonuclease [Planctomycetota bacterium]|nr:Uma2 family endonuclease [Planctomycetota bacterium]
MATRPTLITAEEFALLPGDEPMELVRGEVRRMSSPGARHGGVASQLCRLLGNHIIPRRLGRVFINDTGFVLTRAPDTVRGPDVSFVRQDRLPTGELPVGHIQGAPDLAAEVLSPNATFSAVQEKVHDYLLAGTRMVLVIDPRVRTVTVFRTADAPRILSEHDVLDGDDVVPGLRLQVAELFTP